MKKKTVTLLGGLCLVLVLSGGVLAQLPPVGWAPPGSPVDRFGQLRVTGTQLQSTKTNQNVQLRGMSFFWSSDTEYARKFYNERVVAWLVSDWRVSVLRAALGVSDRGAAQAGFYLPSGSHPGDRVGNLNLMHNVIRASIEQGIYVIIDWHSHSAEAEERHAIEFFEMMATMYKDYPNIIYEIYNEPIDQSWSSQIKPYAERVIDAIRKIDPHNVILVGTPFYCQRVEAPNQDPIRNRTNIMYTVHFYCNHTFRGALETEAARQPFFASEFGLSEAIGNNSCNDNNNSITQWLDLLDRINISWAGWSITNKNETASALRHFPPTNTTDNNRLAQGRWADADLTATGAWLRNRLRGSNPGANRRYNITMTASPTEGGTIQGTGTFDVCTDQSIRAVPANGWRFEGWIINGQVQTPNPFAIELCSDRVGSAIFFRENQLRNSTFTAGASGWSVMTGPGANGTGEVVNGEYRVTVTQAGSTVNNRNLRLQQTGVTLNRGRRYELSFRARAVSGSRTITPVVVNSAGNINFMPDPAPITLTTQMQPFTSQFDMHADTTTAAVVAFYCATEMGNWVIDDVSLRDIGPAQSVSTISQMVVTAPFRTQFNGRALVLSGTDGKRAGVTVYDMAGRVRLSRDVSLSNGGTSVSLDRLPAGVYSVRYKVDGAVLQSERIVLSK